MWPCGFHATSLRLCAGDDPAQAGDVVNLTVELEQRNLEHVRVARPLQLGQLVGVLGEVNLVDI